MRSKPAVADLMSAMVSSVGEGIVTSEEGGQGVTSGVEGVVEVWKGLQVGRVDINIGDLCLPESRHSADHPSGQLSRVPADLIT